MNYFKITREQIIHALTEGLRDNPAVYAFWLEGSDGTDTVDEYSDIDTWIDVEDGEEEDIFLRAEELLSGLGAIDYAYKVNHAHPKIRQRYYHLAGSSEYLLIDFCIQLHSRDKEEATYIKDNKIELPKVIFDKANVIRYKERNEEAAGKTLHKRLYELKNKYRQHSRVIKYVKRGQYLEAFAYYQKYVVNPLIELLRIKYTPDYFHYYLIHISQHLPKDMVERLESFCKVTSVEDIYRKTLEAQAWFEELCKEIEA